MSEEIENPVPTKGHLVVKSYLKTLDGSPGVYRMLDEQGAVLYVGKARNLKRRVSNYAKLTGHSARIGRMITATSSMMFLTTKTETEALLLEQNLIKQLKPRYNVLLRDDKSFPYIMLTGDHEFPMLTKHRGRRSKEHEFFGPFASAGAVNRTLNQLQKIFLLRNCSDNMFAGRTRPCLQYQIARCAGPCTGKISAEDYDKLVSDARDFLRGRNSDIQQSLAAEMSEASQNMEYERAAGLRDRIRALTQVQSTQGINPQTVPEADVIALHSEGDQACIQVFFIRANQNWGNRAYFPRSGVGADDPEILENFIAQFYDNKTPPKLILVSGDISNEDLLLNALGDKRGSKVEIAHPKRGERAELVEGAHRNARETLARKLSESAAQNKLLQGLADALDLEEAPRRVEVFDNSHIQGAHAVGAMIVSGPDGFMKSAYRKFNIKNPETTPGDDFGMMKEVLERRFKSLIKEDPDRQSENWPDLLLIDGGQGQISAVAEILAELGVTDVPFVGVAKGVDRNAGNEEFHRMGARPFALRRNDPVLYFIQRLRDEAHRFAITTHRNKRAKALTASPLDEIPGVGAARKRAILAHFGSAKAATRASLRDLKAVDGLSDALARVIYDFFHDKG
ncbi:UvrABC system protein C [Amylibacter marinus]|uniref:UvrABC system protein C n=1 Tax=Amylibacter marinus TaxID=1475483 RepID=A0ABQ5VXV8_9RHOB|nr:excinuclease ABC subunit UvrC [Amylibacter marinus]GLQ35923.1 UvrABC system protein C [Amylibacter marinus]